MVAGRSTVRRRLEVRNHRAEHRVAGGEVRAGARQGIFTARAITYGTVDLYGSVWSPGCFDKSLARHLPVILFGHSHEEPVGRATSWRSSPEGPEVTAQLDMSPDVPKGRQAAAQLASGTLTDVSVGFWNAKRREPTKEERERWPGVKEVILEADLDELSLVSIGAVPGAKVLSSRSASLARDLAEGRLTPAQWRREMDLERELDEALAIVAGWDVSTRGWQGLADSIAPAEDDPVQRWVGIVEAEAAAREAAQKAAAERARVEAERDQAQAQRRLDNPFSWI